MLNLHFLCPLDVHSTDVHLEVCSILFSSYQDVFFIHLFVGCVFRTLSRLSEPICSFLMAGTFLLILVMIADRYLQRWQASFLLGISGKIASKDVVRHLIFFPMNVFVLV